MKRVTLVTVVLVGCGTCPTVATITDPNGLLTETERGHLVRVVEDFEAWTGGGRACIGEVEVVAGDADATSLRRRGPGAHRLFIGAADPDRDDNLRWGLCRSLLELDPGLAEGAPEPYDDIDALADRCTLAPDDWWVDASQAACGEDGLDPDDAYLRRTIYTAVESRPSEGHVETTRTQRVPLQLRLADSRLITEVVVAEDRLWMALVDVSDPHAKTYFLVEVDPTTGLALSERPLDLPPDASADLFGGDRLLVRTRDYGRLHRLSWWSADGTPHHVDLDPWLQLEGGKVVGDTLWTREYGFFEVPLLGVSLTTGHIREVPMPAYPGLEALVSGDGVLVDGALVMAVYAATVEVDYDVVSVGGHHQDLWRLDLDTERWSVLDIDAWGSPVGVLDDGRVAGTLFNREGNLLGAWDPNTGAVAVDATTCLDSSVGYPRHALGGDLLSIEGTSDAPELVWRTLE